MDTNTVVLEGRLAAPPELRSFDSGARLLRFLLTVRTEEPRRRVDVLPITLWDPPTELLDHDLHPGRRISMTGSVQRRFWEDADGRRSRLEVVAAEVAIRPDDQDEDTTR